MTRDHIAVARKTLGVRLLRKDQQAWERVRAVLAVDHGRQLSHIEVATAARTTYETVRAVRREMGDTYVAPVVPIGRALLSGLHPRHVEALTRLGAAVARGSDMQVRAVLAGPEMQQLITAAKGAT